MFHTALSSQVVLVTETKLETRAVDDATYVLIPQADVQIPLLRAELAEHGLGLIPTEECEPELAPCGRLTVWCYDLAAA